MSFRMVYFKLQKEKVCLIDVLIIKLCDVLVLEEALYVKGLFDGLLRTDLPKSLLISCSFRLDDKLSLFSKYLLRLKISYFEYLKCKLVACFANIDHHLNQCLTVPYHYLIPLLRLHCQPYPPFL